jgi:hypothetical protein
MIRKTVPDMEAVAGETAEQKQPKNRHTAEQLLYFTRLHQFNRNEAICKSTVGGKPHKPTAGVDRQ